MPRDACERSGLKNKLVAVVVHSTKYGESQEINLSTNDKYYSYKEEIGPLRIREFYLSYTLSDLYSGCAQKNVSN